MGQKSPRSRTAKENDEEEMNEEWSPPFAMASRRRETAKEVESGTYMRRVPMSDLISVHAVLTTTSRDSQVTIPARSRGPRRAATFSATLLFAVRDIDGPSNHYQTPSSAGIGTGKGVGTFARHSVLGWMSADGVASCACDRARSRCNCTGANRSAQDVGSCSGRRFPPQPWSRSRTTRHRSSTHPNPSSSPTQRRRQTGQEHAGALKYAARWCWRPRQPVTNALKPYYGSNASQDAFNPPLRHRRLL